MPMRIVERADHFDVIGAKDLVMFMVPKSLPSNDLAMTLGMAAYAPEALWIASMLLFHDGHSKALGMMAATIVTGIGEVAEKHGASFESN